jgi:chemotaxis methyl-accepting protein methylase
VVRVWVIACATGEEAYSIATMLSEYARTLQSPPLIQVFATDLDAEAIQAAREGVYPAAITADVSEERLRGRRGRRLREDPARPVAAAACAAGLISGCTRPAPWA